jgi:RNA polymerase sigma-70 factor (family 1)
LQQIAAGNQSAFEEVFNEYYPRLVFFAQGLSASREEAEDSVIDAFSKFWTGRSNFESLEKIKAFLYTVTRNSIYNEIKKRKLHDSLAKSAHLEAWSEGENIEALHAEVIGSIFNEIENLPDKCRQVVLLTYKEGLSTKEIADQLNISVSNVTSQRARAISLLKMALAEKYPVFIVMALTGILKKMF